MTYHVKLENFAGPLDLLLHLIERSELDIYDIPIALIAEQFLAYLGTMDSLNLEVAGEFLVMAATLMQIKAKMLLPKPITLGEEPADEEEDDPRRELVDRLVEYRRIKEAAALLRQREEERSRLYPRTAGDFADLNKTATPESQSVLSVWELIDAFQTILSAAASDEGSVPVPVEQINMKQVMALLLQHLREAGGSQEFGLFFAERRTRRDLIAAFVALLELIRLGRVLALQDGVFGRILLRLRPEGEGR